MLSLPGPGNISQGTQPPADTIPESAVLKHKEQVQTGGVEKVASTLSSLAEQATGSALVSLLLYKPQIKAKPKQWVGSGLPPIPKATYDRILRWKIVDFTELRPADPLEQLGRLEPDTQRYIMLPGWEVTKGQEEAC